MSVGMTALQVLGVVGLVATGGVLVLWSVFWAPGRRDRHLALLAQAGMVLLTGSTLGTVLLPVGGEVGLLDALQRPEALAAVGVLAVLAALAGFFTDLTSADTRGWRTVFCLGAVAALVGLTTWSLAPDASVTTLLVVGAALATAVLWPGVVAAASIAMSHRMVPQAMPPPTIGWRTGASAVLLIGVTTAGLLVLPDRGPLQGVPPFLVIVAALGVAAVAVASARSLPVDDTPSPDAWGDVSSAPGRWWPIGSRRLW